MNGHSLFRSESHILLKKGYKVGAFRAYITSNVLSGSGISSSAAYEVMLANILNHLYNGGKIPARELACIARYAENEYFGKPCGLMDQMASSVGNLVYIDFLDKNKYTAYKYGVF